MNPISFIISGGLAFILILNVSTTVGAPSQYKEEWHHSHWSSVDPNEEIGGTNREGRQFGGLADIGKVVDSVGKFDLKEVSKFLKEIPELFESVQSIVVGAEKSFGTEVEA